MTAVLPPEKVAQIMFHDPSRAPDVNTLTQEQLEIMAGNRIGYGALLSNFGYSLVPLMLVGGTMALLYLLFAKVVPIISIWEMKIGQHPQLAHEHETTDEKATLWRTHP